MGAAGISGCEECDAGEGKMKRSLCVKVAVTILVMAVAGWWAVSRIRLMGTPPGGGMLVTFSVQHGQPLKAIATQLEEAGLVRSSMYFVWLGRKKDLATRIKAGEYELSSEWYPEKILEVLASGEVVKLHFTIPEGLTLKQIASKLDKEGVVRKDDFIRAAADTAALSRWLAPSAHNLEGVLFPDTYTYTSDDNATDFVNMMCDRFNKVFEPLWDGRDRSLSISPYEAIILASMIEKETADDAERPMVGAVFLNRLKLGMRLMSDPTVIYAMPNFSGNLTRDDLRVPSPYNTYLNSGLPPGPICNPGAGSLRAALHPAATDALYFVARGDGSHQFSKTLDEHNKAVEQYQKQGQR